MGCFRKINAFQVFPICFHKTVYNKWCLDKIVEQIENDLERGNKRAKLRLDIWPKVFIHN